MDLSIIKDFNILEEALRQAAVLAPRVLMGFLVFCASFVHFGLPVSCFGKLSSGCVGLFQAIF